MHMETFAFLQWTVRRAYSRLPRLPPCTAYLHRASSTPEASPTRDIFPHAAASPFSWWNCAFPPKTLKSRSPLPFLTGYGKAAPSEALLPASYDTAGDALSSDVDCLDNDTPATPKHWRRKMAMTGNDVLHHLPWYAHRSFQEVRYRRIGIFIPSATPTHTILI